MEERIGRYVLVKRLAAGGMSDIYLGQVHGARGYERTVVVKTIRGDLVDEEDLGQVLMQEAKIASCLQHENIVELLEVDEAGGQRFLAMEFVFGRDLRRIRERCDELGIRIPFTHLATIFADVLDALGHAHHDATQDGRALQVIHRDVSPQNILVGFDGGTKLLDFGLATAAAQISRTRAGVLKGKYAYMSPEQVTFKSLDHRSDLFSTGIVLWELLTQRRLFFANNDYETVKAVTRCRVPFARALRGDVPWNLAWVAFRALRRSPRWRYSTARSMRAALLRWDQRDREQARNDLADWLAHLFSAQLAAREAALARSRMHPTRFRQIRDAGFELVEEITDPDLRMRRPERRRPKTTPHGSWSGLAGVAAAALSTRRWFIGLFVACVLVCAGLGVYLGSRLSTSPGHAYLYVFADVPDVDVSVGGLPLGLAPVQRVPVLPGRHRVVGRWGGTVQSVEVTVTAGENRVVRLMFPVERK